MAELQSKREILQQTRSGLCAGSEAPLFALTGTSKKAGQVNERIKYHLDDYRGNRCYWSSSVPPLPPLEPVRCFQLRAQSSSFSGNMYRFLQYVVIIEIRYMRGQLRLAVYRFPFSPTSGLMARCHKTMVC